MTIPLNPRIMTQWNIAWFGMTETFALSVKGVDTMDTRVKIARRSDGTHRASCPALPGCVIYGRSRDEVRRKIVWAVRGYLNHIGDILPGELERKRLADTATRPDGIRWGERRSVCQFHKIAPSDLLPATR